MARVRVTGVAVSTLLAMTFCLQARQSYAQLNGFNLKGDQGMKTGSQAPPGGYVALPINWYSADTIRDRDGRSFTSTGDIGLTIGGPLVSFVTKKKLLGANYGAMVVLPFANARIELPRLDENPGPGISDLYLQPINLGWHTPKADFMTGYGIFMPTGRYTAGADDNTGLGMWGQDVFAGTTIFFDENKAWHAASTGSLEFHSKKEDTRARVGTLFTLEGGIGRDFLKGAVSTGVAYYAQWKLTDDTLTGLPALIVRGKNRVAGLGPEVTLPIATKSTLYGLVTMRYQWEFGAHTTTEGQVFNLVVVLPMKPVKVNP